MTVTLAPPDPGTQTDGPQAPPDTPSATATAQPEGWTIVWRGHTYREADLTGQHLALLSILNGTDAWETLDIDPRHGHQRLMNMLAAFEAARSAEGHNVETVNDVLPQAIAAVAATPAEEILGSLRFT